MKAQQDSERELFFISYFSEQFIMSFWQYQKRP